MGYGSDCSPASGCRWSPWRWSPGLRVPLLPTTSPTNITGVWRCVPDSLRRLLFSDILVRACEALADVFLVLYALDVIGIRALEYGVLIGIQMITAIVGYLPGAMMARRMGRKPLVVATFVAFALFPLAVVSAHSFAGLVPAFVIGGLREIGEPARKALIVDSARPDLRARTVGVFTIWSEASASHPRPRWAGCCGRQRRPCPSCLREASVARRTGIRRHWRPGLMGPKPAAGGDRTV